MLLLNSLSKHKLNNIFKSKRFRWFVSGAAVGVLISIGFLVRQPAEPGISSIEGNYSPNIQFAPWYLANYYRLFSPVGELPVISNYTSGLRYGAIDFVHTFLIGAALIITGEKDVEKISNLYYQSPWQGLILLPLAAIAIYGYFSRSIKAPMSPSGVLILCAFSSLSNYAMVAWSISGGFGSPLGWFIFFAIYLFILAIALDEKYSMQWSLLLIISLVLIQPTYHTVALAIMVILTFLGLIQKVLRKKYISYTIVGITIVVFLTFLTFHAVSIFEGYVHLAVDFLADIYRSQDKERLEYSLKILDVSLWWHIINYAAILVPVIWTGIILINRTSKSKREVETITYQWVWLLSLVPLAILFFAWDGIYSAYERLLQYGTLLAIISVAFLLANQRKAVYILAVISMICVIISVFLTKEFNIATSNNLTLDEKSAIEWIKNKKTCDSVIFTDYRIGSTFGYWDCFSVVGPTAKPLVSRGRTALLTSLLYSEDSSKIENAINALRTIDDKPPDLILMSRRFMNPRIGFVLPDTRMKPITEVQWSNYQQLSKWEVVFENSSTMVLGRIGP